LQPQRDVVRFLSAYQETWHRFFPDLHRRGQWHIVAHLCRRSHDGAPVGELSGLVKQVFLLDDATVRERLSELYRLGFCAVEPADRPVSARTLVLPTQLLRAKFDAHLIDTAAHLLAVARAFNPSLRGAVPGQIDPETRLRLLRAIERCNADWLAAIERVFDATGLSMARRLEARRNLLSPSHRMLTLIALGHSYGEPASDDGEGLLADDMAAELLRLLRQNFQTTRDHIGYLVQLGFLERRPGRALRVALTVAVAAELDRAMAESGEELARIAATFARPELDVEQTAMTRPPPVAAPAEARPAAHRLVVTRAGEPDLVVELGATPLVIGRAPSSGLTLVATEVSRAHCQVTLTNGTVSVTDLDSTNGTLVNGQRITHTTDLPPGGVLQLGPYRLTYEHMAGSDVEGTLRSGIAAPATGAPAGPVATAAAVASATARARAPRRRTTV
jgi:hypothetical protein